jgi:signal transduction histidine kinase
VHYQGWLVKCEKGGIRRVLMNLFGNSLKFTNVRIVLTFFVALLTLWIARVCARDIATATV